MTSNPHVRIATVTRHQAQQWLANNLPNNRPVSQPAIDTYARDMDAGEWDCNGETIKFNTAGQLIDGQQRLKAFLQSSCRTWRTAIAEGLAEEAVRTVDAGRVRSFADQLRIQESVEIKAVAQVVRRVMLWEAGFRANTKQAPRYSYSELFAQYRKNPDQYIAAAQRGVDAARVGVGPAWVAGVLYYVAHQLDAEATFAFFDQLVSGANLPEASPILVLRERFREAPARAERYTPPEKLYFCVLAWNAWRADEPMSRFRRFKDLTNANFPTPR